MREKTGAALLWMYPGIDIFRRLSDNSESKRLSVSSTIAPFPFQN